MPPPSNKFGLQGPSNPYPHLHHPLPQHLSSQYQRSGSTGLAPPSLGGHPAFAPSNPNTNLNPFATTASGNSLAGAFGGAAGGLGVGGLAGGGGTGLASHAAQMGFHSAALQQTGHDGPGIGGADGKGMAKGRIRDVWRNNLAQEMHVLRGLIEKFPYISMDTEFPGIVARPMGAFSTKAEYHYQTIRCNVDLLKPIQIGITLFSSSGETPPPHFSDSGINVPTYTNHLIPCPCTWQFNFRYSLHEEMYAQDSITTLQKNGVDFDQHEKMGIDPFEFGALLMTSGLVLQPDVHWISFHAAYDFGYLTRIMLQNPLPANFSAYHKLVDAFFPNLYDIKYLIKSAQSNQAVNDSPLSANASNIVNGIGGKWGLAEMAEELSIKRVGPPHLAGPDSLLTGKIFWELRRSVFEDYIEHDKYVGQLWGLDGIGVPASGAAAAAANAMSQQQQQGTQQQGQQQHGGSTPNPPPQNNGNQALYMNGAAPSTPNVSHAGLASSTPGPLGQGGGGGGGLGPLTPGGGGGVFGGFQFGKG
ncbi:MAG: hypothetical protein M1835_007334 [Candelina submexicana]|nr:MAG: hypothetical protein M1835_007334 [Candelina submexicana]